MYPARDPLDRRNWSGTPAGLAQGLLDNGVDLVPIAANVPRGLHELVAALSHSTGQRGAVADRMPIRHWARTRALTKSLNAAGKLDAVVAMGTEMYDLSAVVGAHFPCITYDDGTYRQMVSHPESDISQAGFPKDHVEKWIRQQSRSCSAASLCCTSTSWAAASMEADYKVPSSRIAVVGMGHRPRTTAASDRDWSTPRFLFVGVDWQRKNGAAVLAAFSKVRELYPNSTLHLVGEHPQIDEPGVTGYGLIPRNDTEGQLRLDGLYATATAFVLPSKFDPSPISYLEAASAGLPVIATSVGGAGELLGSGAITVDPRDTRQIELAMLRLCQPNEAKALGAAAKAAALTSSWSDVAGRILTAFNALETETQILRSPYTIGARRSDDAAREQDKGWLV